MTTSEFYYTHTVTQNSAMLKNLKMCLQKASIFAQNKKCEEQVLLNDRLAPDMFHLIKQVQIATDTAKLAASRLSGKQAPVFEDTEKTMEELYRRIDKTVSYLSEFKTEDFADGDNKIATFPWNPGKGLKGRDYFVGFVIPNVYFHVAAVYMILRTNGVDLGKADFLGELPFIPA